MGSPQIEFGSAPVAAACSVVAFLFGVIPLYVGASARSSGLTQEFDQITITLGYFFLCVLLPGAVFLKSEPLLVASAVLWTFAGFEWSDLHSAATSAIDSDKDQQTFLAGAIIAITFLGLGLVSALAPLEKLSEQASKGQFAQLAVVPIGIICLIINHAGDKHRASVDSRYDASQQVFNLMFFSILAYFQTRPAYMILVPVFATVLLQTATAALSADMSTETFADIDNGFNALAIIMAFVSYAASWLQFKGRMEDHKIGEILVVGPALAFAFLGCIVVYSGAADADDVLRDDEANNFNQIASVSGVVFIVLLGASSVTNNEGLLAAAVGLFVVFGIVSVDELDVLVNDQDSATQKTVLAGLVIMSLGIPAALISASGSPEQMSSPSFGPFQAGHVGTFVFSIIGLIVLFESSDSPPLASVRLSIAGFVYVNLFLTLMAMLNVRLAYSLLLQFSNISVLRLTLRLYAVTKADDDDGGSAAVTMFLFASLCSLGGSFLQYNSNEKAEEQLNDLKLA